MCTDTGTLSIQITQGLVLQMVGYNDKLKAPDGTSYTFFLFSFFFNQNIYEVNMWTHAHQEILKKKYPPSNHKIPIAGLLRPVLYRLSFAEMVVPYGDPVRL